MSADRRILGAGRSWTVVLLLAFAFGCAKPDPVEVEVTWQAIDAAEEAARNAEAYRPTRQQRITYEQGIRLAKEAHAEGDYANARTLAQEARISAMRVRAEQERARRVVIDRMEQVRILAKEVHAKPDWGLDLERLFISVQEAVAQGQAEYDAGDYAAATASADQAIEYLTRRRALFQKDIEVTPRTPYLDAEAAAAAQAAATSAAHPETTVNRSGAGGDESVDPEADDSSFLRRLRDSLRGGE